jgi:hypothetical protein
MRDGLVKTRYLLCRILGNDLYPRHRPTQTLENTRFILDHEPALDGVEKCWVINKIVDKKALRSITALLKNRSQRFIEIPFDEKAFKALPRSDNDRRSHCLFGLNQVRNRILREYSGAAEWVLPFDGNCIFGPQGWTGVTDGLSDQRDKNYLVIPMLRLADIRKFVRMTRSGTGESVESLAASAVRSEPQIMFRANCADAFDEQFVYSRFDKVDLLWRLGVPGPWDEWLRSRGGDPGWEAKRAGLAGQYTERGYVWRLPSGNDRAERDIDRRGADRDLGVSSLMRKIDYGPAAFSLFLAYSRLKNALLSVPGVRRLKDSILRRGKPRN